MQNLINIQTRENQNIVSARDVWQFLEAKKKFADWIKYRIIKYGLVEGQDFMTYSQNSEKGRPEIEYLLTLDTAKQLAMVEGNDKGRQARQYFIDCEKTLHAVREIVITAQRNALECQKEGFDLLSELEQIKRDHAPVFKRMSQIKKRLKSLQNATFQQLGLFQRNNSDSHE